MLDPINKFQFFQTDDWDDDDWQAIYRHSLDDHLSPYKERLNFQPNSSETPSPK
jgi:hypothetical protein